MPRKRTDTAAPVEQSLEGGGAAESESVAEVKKQRKTLVIPIKDDGSVDFEGMRDSTAAKLRAALGEDARPVLGQVEIKPTETGFVYDFIGGAEAMILTRFFGVDQDLAVAIFGYNTDEKQQLSEPTARVLSKYGGKMLKWKDEAALIGMLYQIHTIKWAALQKAITDRAEKVEAARRTADIARPIAAGG